MGGISQSNILIIIGVVLLSILYLDPSIVSLFDSKLLSLGAEKFTQRINNLQSLPFALRDRDVFERRRDYHRMNPSEYSRIGTKPPEPIVPDVKDAIVNVNNGRVKIDPAFTHTNMVPFFKNQPYTTYTDGDASHPQLDRYSGDRPKKSVIAPLYELGKTRYSNLNETSLIGNYQREVDNYSTNSDTHNSKNFEFVGGDPIRVGRGIITEDTDLINGTNAINSKELRDGTVPSGGFHSMYRPDELTREQLTGETRPLFNEAYVFVGINGEGVNVPADPSFIGEQTKALKAKAFSLDDCKSPIATSGTVSQMSRADIVRKQQRTNDAPNPYRGPALLAQSSGVDNIESVYEPRLPKTLDTVNCVNYYATTSDPATYEVRNVSDVRDANDVSEVRNASDVKGGNSDVKGTSFVSKYAVNVARDIRSNNPMRDTGRESYADYSYIKDSTQQHVYKDYDPYDYNTVHTGNEYINVTRTGNIHSEQRPVLYDPSNTDRVPMSAETERIRKLAQRKVNGQQGVTEFGTVTDRTVDEIGKVPQGSKMVKQLADSSVNGKQTATTVGYSADRNMYTGTDNDPFRIEYIGINRDNVPRVQDTCVSIDNSGEYRYREDRKSNEYIEQKPEQYNTQRQDNRSGYQLMDIALYTEKRAGTLTERIGTLGSGIIKTLFSIGTDDIKDSVKVNDRRNVINALEHSNGHGNRYQDSTRVTPELRKSAVQYDQRTETLFNSSNTVGSITDRTSNNVNSKNATVVKGETRENIRVNNDFMKET